MKIESKEQLAKLLATEDLDIQHQQVPTAYFDVTNRALILPIWKDMPDFLYDLLVGHEVGHALFSPTSIERLKKAYKKTSKSCINIIEDARIERLVKNRYPGLRKRFFSGYKHLGEKDFFGVSEKTPDQLNILDKINLYFKSQSSIEISFNDEEQVFVDRIEKAKSFKDVEKIAEDVYAYAKANKTDLEKLEDALTDKHNALPSEEKFDGEESESADEENEESDEKGDTGSGDESDEDIDSEEKESADGEGDDSPVDEEQQALDNYMQDERGLGDEEESEEKDVSDEKPESNKPKDEVASTTYEHFQERLDGLVKLDTTNVYLTVPEKVDLDSGVEDYKVVHKKINDFYASRDGSQWENRYSSAGYSNESKDKAFKSLKDHIYKNANETLTKLKKDSVKTVNHIAMEFERKKAADVYKKTLITKTGVLDTNKLFSAKYNEDVFRKNVRVPDGKSHGLVMIIDWSGSMNDNIYGCIKQVIELSFFCKKVNIPFDVYSFRERNDSEGYGDECKRTPLTFKYKHGDFVTDSRVQLRNYISSRMNAKDYNNALLNMCILANRFNHNLYRPGSGHYQYPIPNDDGLGCTPLNGAILLSEHVIRKFKKENNLECVHAVWLTDGESSGNVSKYDATKEKYNNFTRDGLYNEKANIYIKDPKTKKNHLICKGGYYGAGRATTPVCLDIVKDRLGINIIGFFIVNTFSSSSLWRFAPKKDHSKSYLETQQEFKTWMKKVKKDGFIVKEQSGYDEYYVIKGETFKQDVDDNLDVRPEMTPRKMATNFMKKNNQFKTNRIILSRFVDLITAKSLA